MSRWRIGVVLILASGLLGCGSPRAGQSRSAEVQDAFHHRMMTSAHTAFARGDIARAAELYERAWTRARLADRPMAIGTSAYNLALCRIALGQTEQVTQLLDEAINEFERAGQATFDVRLVQAEFLRTQGNPMEAWSITGALLDDGPPRAILAQTLTLRALLAVDKNEIEIARNYWQEAERPVRRVQDERLIARRAEIEGMLAWFDEDFHAAARAFDREAVHYRNLARYADMSRALARAADAWMQAGKPVNALDRSYRAARHHAAAAQWAEALQRLDRALPALESDAVDEAMIARVAALVDEVAREMKKEAARDVQ